MARIRVRASIASNIRASNSRATRSTTDAHASPRRFASLSSAHSFTVWRTRVLPSLMDEQDDHSPNLWWPEDSAWCVATEIDLVTALLDLGTAELHTWRGTV